MTTTASTEYEHGTSADLANDVHVFVKGVADATGVLVAHKIAFREVSEIRIVAQVDAIAPYGELVLLGLEVATTDYDGLPGHVGAGAARLRLRDDVVVGTWLDVRGYEEPAGSGRVVATHVVRIDPADGVRLRGPFRDPAPPSFDILSVLVTTSDATRFVLEGNVRITAAEFFARRRANSSKPGAPGARRC